MVHQMQLAWSLMSVSDHHHTISETHRTSATGAVRGGSGSGPNLLSLVEDGLWGEAISRASAHPEEAKESNGDGGRALHQACMNDAPLDVVSALLEAFPAATLVQDDDGWTPLHTACYFDASHKVVRRLLQANIAPLHLIDAEGRTPLRLLHSVTSSRWRENRIVEMIKGSGHVMEGRRTGKMNELLREDPDLARIWNKARLLICGSYHGTVETCEDQLNSGAFRFRLVHACSGIDDCPTDFLKLAVGMHPEQLGEPDEAGNLPLHIAARTSRQRVGETSASTVGSLPPSTTHVSNGKKDDTPKFHPINFLVAAYPEAACVRNRQGRLPLHLSIIDGKKVWEEGVQAVLGAYPAAINEGDEDTGLYPFMSAAVGCDGDSADVDDASHLGTIYRLFHACPELERFSRCPRRRRTGINGEYIGVQTDDKDEADSLIPDTGLRQIRKSSSSVNNLVDATCASGGVIVSGTKRGWSSGAFLRERNAKNARGSSSTG